MPVVVAGEARRARADRVLGLRRRPRSWMLRWRITLAAVVVEMALSTASPRSSSSQMAAELLFLLRRLLRLWATTTSI